MNEITVTLVVNESKLSDSEWAGRENADFWATDLGSAVSNVVLRIVGQSVASAALGH